jgi:hypothetical protein
MPSPGDFVQPGQGTATPLLDPPPSQAYALDPLKDSRHREATSARDEQP